VITKKTVEETETEDLLEIVKRIMQDLAFEYGKSAEEIAKMIEY